MKSIIHCRVSLHSTVNYRVQYSKDFTSIEDFEEKVADIETIRIPLAAKFGFDRRALVLYACRASASASA